MFGFGSDEILMSSSCDCSEILPAPLHRAYTQSYAAVWSRFSEEDLQGIQRHLVEFFLSSVNIAW